MANELTHRVFTGGEATGLQFVIFSHPPPHHHHFLLCRPIPTVDPIPMVDPLPIVDPLPMMDPTPIVDPLPMVDPLTMVDPIPIDCHLYCALNFRRRSTEAISSCYW